tara:strand:+ start:892 stop:1404 length:513 start_codon:yes stop_codon:yes gene_type:complete
MANIYLVTSSEIAKNTPMGGNVDPDKYTNLIIDVQDLVLEPVLGTKLYDKILADFDADTLTGVYETMFDNYIKQVMWHSVFASYINLGSVWVSNKGILKHLAENSESATQDEIDSLAKAYQSKADAYIARLERYLCDVDVPEYDTQDENYDIDPKTGLRTISGLFFGDNI